VPCAFPQFAAVALEARVTYADGTVVEVEPVDDAFRQQVRDTIALLSNAIPLPHNPGPARCLWCDVPNCERRWRAASTDLFD
jgi:predicted acylesterase/phospholipase RssA